MSGRAPAWAGWRCEECSRTHKAVHHPHGEPCPYCPECGGDRAMPPGHPAGCDCEEGS